MPSCLFLALQLVFLALQLCACMFTDSVVCLVPFFVSPGLVLGWRCPVAQQWAWCLQGQGKALQGSWTLPPSSGENSDGRSHWAYWGGCGGLGAGLDSAVATLGRHRGCACLCTCQQQHMRHKW